MSNNITLIMTRTPLEEVNFGKKNGRWGRMIVVKGGKILSGRFTDIFNLPDLFAVGPLTAGIGVLANFTSAVVTAGFGKQTFRIGTKGISLDTLGGDVEVIARFDTLERFRTDSNKSKYYVQLKPRPSMPYEIRMDISQNVKELNETGQCFRVHGHNTKNGNGGNAGILIHEAPHPGWLIGCIGPRELNNRTVGNNKTSSRSAMKTIFSLMGGFSKGRKADLLVMDW